MIGEINLSEHEGTEEFALVTHDHKANSIETSDGKIQIKTATCPEPRSNLCKDKLYLKS